MDAFHDRAIYASGTVIIYLTDQAVGEQEKIAAELEQVSWIWLDENNKKEKFYIHLAESKLECKLHFSEKHNTAAWKVYRRYTRNVSDRVRMLKYGVKIKLPPELVCFSQGEHANMPRNTPYAKEIYDASLAIEKGNSTRKSQTAGDQEETDAAINEWAQGMHALLNMAEDRENALAKKTAYEYHSFAAADQYKIRGVAYIFRLSEFKQEHAVADFVIAAEEFPPETKGLPVGRVVEIVDEGVVLSFSYTVDHGKIPSNGYLIMQPNPLLYKIKRETLNSIVKKETNNENLIDNLIHEQFQGFQSLDKPLRFFADDMTEAQREAVTAGVTTEDFLLVQGPPGTGKTTIIVEMVRQFLKEEKRILISSQNNSAVDNVLEELANENIPCIRVGREEKVKPHIQPFLFDRAALKFQEQITDSAQISHERFQKHAKQQQGFLTIMDTQAGLIEEYQVLRQQVVQKRQELQQLEWLVDLVNMPYWFGQLGSGSFSSLVPSLISRLQQRCAASWRNRRETTGFYCAKAAQIKTLEVEAANKENMLTALLAQYGLEMDWSILVNPQWRQLAQKYYEGLQAQETVLSEWLDQLNKRQTSLYPLLLQQAKVIGATCMGINTSPAFKTIDFDVAIIDEAGQITIFDILVPMSRAKKVILIGDHMQLPPAIDQDLIRKAEEAGLDSDYLKKSLFELLFKTCPDRKKCLLDKQFRFHPVVCSFLSQQFYANKYVSGSKQHNNTYQWDLFRSPLVWIDTDQMDDKNELVEIDGDHNVYYNKTEADLIITALGHLTARGIEPREIGIIAPYRRQKEELIKRVRAHFSKRLHAAEVDEAMRQIEIDSVDAFQGRGKPVILFSLTRSNEDGTVGFLDDLRRMNVAMSRCKKLVVLVGDSGHFATAKKRETAQFFRALKNYIRQNGQLIDGVTYGQ